MKKECTNCFWAETHFNILVCKNINAPKENYYTDIADLNACEEWKEEC